MSTVNALDNRLIQSQLAAARLQNDIAVRVAKKGLDITRNQGEMVLSLLEEAAQLAKTSAGRPPAPTLGSIVSGLGQKIDLKA